ncbi:MAG: sialate O-acetylesterase [Flavisolibacter sp.]
MKPGKKFCTILLMLFAVQSASSQVQLPRIFRDSMILQRGTGTKIWGSAAPQEKVSLSFQNKNYNTTADKNGKWQIEFGYLRAGGPFTLQLNASNKITLSEVLVGDVWLCSGQSNMVHQMKLHKDLYQQEIETANVPFIRQFWVPNATNLVQPNADLAGGSWKAAVKNDIVDFSAVAYFFAKQLYLKYKVPIGIINASVGGSPIEAWMSENALKDFPSTFSFLQKNKDTTLFYANNRNAAAFNAAIKQPEDEGVKASMPWFSKNFVPKNWQRMAVPGYWEDQGAQSLDGILWFRKEIELPEKATAQAAKLVLGRIVDADEVYINGKKIGSTSYQYPQRRYSIPAGVLQRGKNTIVVRITNYGGKGGFVPDKPYAIVSGNDSFSLAGYWQYKVGAVFNNTVQLKPVINPEYQPSALYNAMIAPLIYFNIKGMVWYQGESNISNATAYGKLLRGLIADWRQKWQQEKLPFLFVQLPGFGDKQYKPAESYLALLRDEQRKSLSVPNTQMAVTIDLGEWNDVHPDRKKEVGERLAAAALHDVYGEKTVTGASPLPLQAKWNGKEIEISFANVSGLKTSDGKPPAEFAIAGKDKKFVWANARIENGKLMVWSNSIAQPKFVRYAWADTPVNPNLFNSEGLLASPFEISVTDSTTDGPWKGRKAAVVLTYDDALNVDLTNAIPALDAAGLKGTFYISDYFGGLKNQISGWRKAAAEGHELGNHTIFHACAGRLPGRSFVQPDYDLDHYTVRRMQDEIKAMNNLLQAIDGKTKRTFAYPCGDMNINDTAYIDNNLSNIVAARSVRSEMPTIKQVNLFDIPSYGINGHTGGEMIALVKQAIEKKALLVFLFHGVGGEHSLNVSLEAHRELLEFLSNNQQDVWVAPMIDVIDFVKEFTKNNEKKNSTQK